MNQLESNIINIYGERGKVWLIELPMLVKQIAAEHHLTDLQSVKNLSYNYVLAGYQGTQPIILKLGLDVEGLRREADALIAFARHGAVNVVASSKGILILERSIPGISLKADLLSKDQNAISIACGAMKRLHQAPLPKAGQFPLYTDWLMILDKDWNIPAKYLNKARLLRDRLLATSTQNVLLHGDLHHDNILQNGVDWLVIDPKGVIGDPVNEVWTFIMDMENDTQFVANYFGFELQAVRDWYFVHLVLAACWNLEDNIDAQLFIALAAKAYPMVSK